MGRNNQQRRRAKAKVRNRAGHPQARERAGLGGGLHDVGSRSDRARDGWPAGGAGGPDGPSWLDAIFSERSHDAPTVAARQAPPLTEREVGMWIDILMGRSSVLSPHVAQQLLAEAVADRRGQALATRAVLDRLLAGVQETWRRGWRPSEVHRIAPRMSDEAAARLVVDAMAMDLSRYAPGTITPTWLDQVDQIGDGVWWPADSDPLRARVAQSRSSHAVHAVLDDAIRAALVLQAMPVLEVLDPLPGQWREQDPANSGSSPSRADAKLLERVRQLLAKAESTPYEAEAETFTAAAQKLMARHSIDLAMLAATGHGGAPDGPGTVRIGIDRPYEQPKVMLLDAVAQANRCRTVWSSGVSLVTVVGFPADLEAVETLFTSLLLQVTRALAAAGTRKSAWGSRTRSFRSSFLASFAVRIGERLRTEAESIVDEVAAQMARSGGPGTDLVLVLRERTEEVEAAMAQRFPELVTKRVGGTGDAEGWAAGRRAADSANLRMRDELPT